MARYAWVLEVRPGCEEEYKYRHDTIWPELVEEIKRAGQRNYAVFRCGLTLFGYFECDDIELVFKVMRESEVYKRWGESMAPLMKSDANPLTGYPYLLPIMWQMD
jgi:L-rhamnose mutarotase